MSRKSRSRSGTKDKQSKKDDLPVDDAPEDDMEDLVKRAAKLQMDNGNSDVVLDDPNDPNQIIFSPWQYTDANAARELEQNAQNDLVEGKGDMEADRKGLLRRLREAVGGLDLTKIAIPVYYNEPTSFLHRMCEACQYYSLLNEGAATNDPVLRLLYVTAFAIVPYASAERTLKPFNPILGETFEWTTPDARFIAEQVSHHPPICAGHMETKTWEFWQHKIVKANFTGNSVVAPPLGNTHIRFKDNDGEYSWQGLTSCVHNLIVGKLWVDHYGKFDVTPAKGKEVAHVTFTQCGWFSKGWHQVKASICDASGKEVYILDGHWNDKLYMRRSGEGTDKRVLLWEKDRRPAKDAHASFKGFSQHGQELNELTATRRKTLIASDSRFRPDCRWLARLNYSKAGKQKWLLEEQQRAERKRRNGSKGKPADEPWKQRWFKAQTPDAKIEQTEWEFTREYWVEREKRLAAMNVEDDVTPPTSEF